MKEKAWEQIYPPSPRVLKGPKSAGFYSVKFVVRPSFFCCCWYQVQTIMCVYTDSYSTGINTIGNVTQDFWTFHDKFITRILIPVSLKFPIVINVAQLIHDDSDVQMSSSTIKTAPSLSLSIPWGRRTSVGPERDWVKSQIWIYALFVMAFNPGQHLRP